MKRTLLALSIFLLTALLLSGCGTKSTVGTAQQSNSGHQATEIRIGTQVGPHYAPLFVVKEKKWLEDEFSKIGVTVKWVPFAAGPPMNEALAAGQLDLGFMGDSPAIIAKSAGQDNSIIAIASRAPQGLAVVLSKKSPLNTVQDLKGKKVGVVVGSYGHHLLALVLQKNGLSLSDVQVINLPHTDIPTALDKGDIDAGVIWEPLITQLQDKDAIRILADGTGLKKGEIVLVARNAFAETNPQLIDIFLKTYLRGYDFVKQNSQESASLITPDVKLDASQLARVMSKFDYNPVIQDDDITELKATTQFMKDNSLIKTPVDIDHFIDRSYEKQAGIL
ncbi:MAG TPA: aliphatic sulfonate ABC transporter substrate-binding protein [Syntrophomonadaceae bacterium]|nr:aliphatic sulfonate ABC transporter substrate-binding protein [Syntrophomonadaceae bacterium]